MKLPNELKLIIYKYSNDETRIKLHSVFKWSYKIGCPLKFTPFKKMIEFEIPSNLHDIHNINLNFIALKTSYFIWEIIEKYIFYCNDLPLEIIDAIFLCYDTTFYRTNKCNYNLQFWFNRDNNPLPIIKDKNFKIKIYFIDPVINLQINYK